MTFAANAHGTLVRSSMKRKESRKWSTFPLSSLASYSPESAPADDTAPSAAFQEKSGRGIKWRAEMVEEVLSNSQLIRF